MSQTSTSKPTTATEEATAGKEFRSAISRVHNLSIFFVGIGIYAIVGFALNQIGLFGDYQMTYFAVGAVVGAVGLLLLLLAR